MNYQVETPTEAHSAEWLENIGDEGAVQYCCDREESCVMLTAGWANVEFCPACGTDTVIDSEEVRE